MAGDKAFITECPRDAMQGLHDFIPTELKISYLNTLLKAGFDRLDFGSFVSPKAIPQMRDTAEVLEGLDLTGSTELLAIIANKRGAADASGYAAISYLGYPFSVSETFQKRNTNAGIEESFDTVKAVFDIASSSEKSLLVYISMAFGNPYGDSWNSGIVTSWISRLRDTELKDLHWPIQLDWQNQKTSHTWSIQSLTSFPELERGSSALPSRQLEIQS
jgi:hydroxymethylglutaryl-CoA lyase